MNSLAYIIRYGVFPLKVKTHTFPTPHLTPDSKTFPLHFIVQILHAYGYF